MVTYQLLGECENMQWDKNTVPLSPCTFRFLLSYFLNRLSLIDMHVLYYISNKNKFSG